MDNYKPKKIKLSHEKFEEVIEGALNLFDVRINELYNYTISLSKLNSMLMNIITATNSILKNKKIFSDKEYNKVLNKIIEDNEKALDNAKIQAMMQQNIFNDIMDTNKNFEFDKYSDEEIAHC